MQSEIIFIEFYSIFKKAKICVKNSSANSSNDTEYRTWYTGLLCTQYGEEVFHHTNLEHYRTLKSKTKAVKAKMLIKVAN